MGCRLTRNLLSRSSDYAVDYVEVSEAGRRNLAALGVTVLTPQAQALARADVVILAVPDRLIGAVAQEIVPQLAPGTMVLSLDPAAAYAEVLPLRDDLSYFVAHPCHPPIFGDDRPAAADTDWFGGASAPQSVVCALYRGPEEDYGRGEQLAAALFAPIIRMHRITVEQMAILEPAVVESTMICCLGMAREAMEEAVRLGVPRAAAEDFCLGHLRTEIAIIFGFADFPFSDGAKRAVEQNTRRIARDDWKSVLAIPAIRQSVRDITGH